MTNIRKFLIALLLISLQAKGADPTKKIIYKKSETHKFFGLKLKGEFKKPDLSYIYQRKGIRSEQIIDIPEDFNPQIRQDANRF